MSYLFIKGGIFADSKKSKLPFYQCAINNAILKWQIEKWCSTLQRITFLILFTNWSYGIIPLAIKIMKVTISLWYSIKTDTSTVYWNLSTTTLSTIRYLKRTMYTNISLFFLKGEIATLMTEARWQSSYLVRQRRQWRTR